MQRHGGQRSSASSSTGGSKSTPTLSSALSKMNGVDPLAWLQQTLERIADGWTISRIDQLMPWNFTPDTP